MSDQRGAEETGNTENEMPDNERNTSRSTESGISLDELMYSTSSYHAIVKPVTMTMILAGLAVTYVSTPSTKRMLQESMSNSYTVFDVSDNTDGGGSHHNNAEKLGLSLINGLIMISFIAILTFGIVLLYKYRCMKCLRGYMIFSSAALLGFLGWLMFDVFIMRYRIPIDQISFYFIIVNFAVVGVIAIFYQKGIPMFITQTYLVLSSVIVAWQFSNFNSWTTWTLLVLLALYDLCAVLTPCGPLKFLVDLMSKEDAPDMPGLLYEASLPAGVERPGNQMCRSANSNGNSNTHPEEVEGRRVGNSPSTGGVRNRGSVEHDSTNATINSDPTPSPTATTSLIHENDGDHVEIEVGLPQNPNTLQSIEREAVRPISRFEEGTDESLPTIPLAIALIYRVDILSPACYATVNQTSPLSREGLSPSQLRAHVEVRFPSNGGKIIPTQGTTTGSNDGSPHRRRGNRNDLELKYSILNRHGNLKRILVVDEEGRVFQETESEGNAPMDATSSGNHSIKLGLGDFIFYSVLVAKASEFSFATFAACMLVILAGLGSTLILLSVYHQALPALPISIFLGVIFYLLTRTCIEPWIEAMLAIPIYV